MANPESGGTRPDPWRTHYGTARGRLLKLAFYCEPHPCCHSEGDQCDFRAVYPDSRGNRPISARGGIWVPRRRPPPSPRSFSLYFASLSRSLLKNELGYVGRGLLPPPGPNVSRDVNRAKSAGAFYAK